MKKVAMDRHARALIKMYKDASGLGSISAVIDGLLDGTRPAMEMTANDFDKRFMSAKRFSILSIRPETFERLRDYKKERRLKTYGWAIRNLFSELGYDHLVKRTLKVMGGKPDAISW